jgi:TatD DNase family protein
MELFDTHAHFEGSETEIREILGRATAAGVGAVMAVGAWPELNRGALAAARIGAELAMRLPVALGWDRDQCARELPELDCSLAAAVGEIGLDYHYDGASRREQLEHFSRQLELASRLGKPVVIHTREADDDTLGVLREIPSKGVIHCFTGSPEFCRKLLFQRHCLFCYSLEVVDHILLIFSEHLQNLRFLNVYLLCAFLYFMAVEHLLHRRIERSKHPYSHYCCHRCR